MLISLLVDNSFTKRSNPIIVIYSKTLSIANNEILRIEKKNNYVSKSPKMTSVQNVVLWTHNSLKKVLSIIFFLIVDKFLEKINKIETNV